MNITAAASALIGGLMTVAGATSSLAAAQPAAAPAHCVAPARNLSIGMHDSGSGDVTALQQFLQSNGYLTSRATGYFGALTLKALVSFQADAGIPASGYAGARTRAAIAAWCGTARTSASTEDGTSSVASAVAASGATPAASSSVSVDGIDAPATLAAGSIGTWTIHASEAGNGNLHYAVSWGDDAAAPAFAAQSAIQTQSSATFMHVYNQPGTYQPSFIVTDDAGDAASTSTSVVITPLQNQ